MAFPKGGKMPKKAPKAKKGFMPFEKSKKDVEPKGMKEGSKKEEAMDAMQMKFKRGGKC